MQLGVSAASRTVARSSQVSHPLISQVRTWFLITLSRPTAPLSSSSMRSMRHT